VTLGGIEVFYTEDLDGGGARYGQDYIRFVSQNIGTRRRVFEWCCGPGFIGFSLLGHGFAETICLADVNPAAIDACIETIQRNGLDDQVTVYLSDCLDDIPPHEVWDLVVGNPPHVGTGDVVPEIARPPIIYQDAGWELHRRFYASVRPHLDVDGEIVIQENLRFSQPHAFQSMLEANGLHLVEAPLCEAPPGNTLYYYVWSKPSPRHDREDDVVASA
jgi:methylase of polypeptide subunit release factors